MTPTLSINAAIQLIEFIENTNYRTCRLDEGAFSSKQEAITHIHSNEYDIEEPISVTFDTAQGDYWDDAQVFFDGSTWFVDDVNMGGLSSSGKSIEEALVNFRLLHDSTSQYYPVELIVSSGTISANETANKHSA